MAADEGSAPLLDWLDDPFLPSFLNEPDTYSIADNDCDWWAQSDLITNPAHILHLPPTAASAAASPSGPTTVPILTPATELPKKRRRWGEENDTTNSSDSGEINRKQLVSAGRKSSGKVTGGSSGNSSSSKEARWAEQLLNPLAAAIDACNLSRVQHLLYVLQELASPGGDANHRLASHGLRALMHHISAPVAGVEGSPAPTFATTEPKQFRLALIRFNEVSPWFAFPNSLANASILQALNLETAQRRRRNLHVVDIGVSHGIQWPTMLEALTRRPSGAPQLVRLTDAGGAVPQGPFSSPPHGYDFPSHLLRYAKTIDLNLRIERASDLTPASLGVDRDEVLVVCAQFRAHHCEGEQRTALLRSVRGLDPDLVILTEVEGGEREAAGFARRAEFLWRFLESTSAAFKGRDCAERRVVEGEMARVLERGGGEELGEGRERWRERMLGLGFQEERFGDEAVDGGRALLRKYDSNWEMRTALDSAVGIGLWWKGQPVSFCSIWKTTKVYDHDLI